MNFRKKQAHIIAEAVKATLPSRTQTSVSKYRIACDLALLFQDPVPHQPLAHQINKPELPVASGEMSTRLAWGISLASLVTGPLIVYNSFSPLIFRLYALGLLVGGLYSVPPFSFKRFPVVAGLTIACVRGFLLNFGVYHAVREALGVAFRWNPVVLFLARFMVVFAGVIAVTKVGRGVRCAACGLAFVVVVGCCCCVSHRRIA